MKTVITVNALLPLYLESRLFEQAFSTENFISMIYDSLYYNNIILMLSL